ncbi:hypothetical protein HGG75_09110 [Ochrobactrum pseudogrignonense]|nr:hypothetical protein [Brucella pseudogrignonensis]
MEVERHSDIAIIGTGPVALFQFFSWACSALRAVCLIQRAEQAVSVLRFMQTSPF